MCSYIQQSPGDYVIPTHVLGQTNNDRNLFQTKETSHFTDVSNHLHLLIQWQNV